uniref:PHD-type domain-containing protein n=1 Tax=Strigamia maritima TaxID=126957 RepID=T1ITE2_STRMM
MTYERVICYCRKKKRKHQLVKCSNCNESFHKNCLIEKGLSFEEITGPKAVSYSDTKMCRNSLGAIATQKSVEIAAALN